MLGYVVTYFLASIPFGLIFAWVSGVGDIRKVGSGNIGATNVLRTGRKDLALLTLLCDGLKGGVPLVLFPQCMPHVLIAIAVLGHMFPIWLKFRGGKGVATALGGYVTAFPLLGFSVLGVWLVVATVMRVSSLAALISFSMAPLFAWAFYGQGVALFALMLAGFLLWAHRGNLYRLYQGQELST